MCIIGSGTREERVVIRVVFEVREVIVKEDRHIFSSHAVSEKFADIFGNL